MDELNDRLADLPSSHQTNGTAACAVTKQPFERIHTVSKRKRKDKGECPLFSMSCPFKNVCSNGAPLVAQLDYQRWAIFLDEDEPAIQAGAPLSTTLKTGTKKSHRAAENVHFVRNFIKKKIDRHAYNQLTVRLYHVYERMERLLEEHKDDPVYGPLHFPKELNR